ncbi:hypothetical protein AWH48_12235 [Domibacillus aminovorans]|uniref:Uncharacterized protein n=1 Tax=Domibacillus aminovorans TaxID=29332 RepID=A0A177KI95_9BACI|nr:hypothetical protein [Domibacillus aminovorans]OAH53118.1 hypothetical protein AWH48_12235 [Domibacillus aminovorans]
MEKGNIGPALKRTRGGQTQLEFAMDIEGLPRETLSSYETGRVNIPPDISRKVVKLKDDPWFVMALRYEYTRTGPVRLEGKKVDLQRSSTKEKLLEEIEEATEAIKATKLSNKLSYLSSFEKQVLEKALGQVVDLITASEHLLGVVCEEADISYLGVWQDHYNKLITRGYANKEQIVGGQA